MIKLIIKFLNFFKKNSVMVLQANLAIINIYNLFLNLLKTGNLNKDFSFDELIYNLNILFLYIYNYFIFKNFFYLMKNITEIKKNRVLFYKLVFKYLIICFWFCLLLIFNFYFNSI